MVSQRVWYDWATFTFTHIYKDIHALIPKTRDCATLHGKRYRDFDASSGSWVGGSISDYTGRREAMEWLTVEAANAGCENEGRSPRASLEAGKDKSPKTSLLLYLVLSRVQLFCDPLGCNHPGSSVHGDSPGENSGVGCHALLQGIFPTQGSNLCLPHCRQILCHLRHQGNPKSCLETSKWIQSHRHLDF